MGGPAHFDGLESEDAHTGLPASLGFLVSRQKGNKAVGKRRYLFPVSLKLCECLFSPRISLTFWAQAVSRVQALALGQLARFHFSLEFEICPVLTFLVKRLSCAHVRNPPSLHFAQLPSLHKVLSQFSLRAAEYNENFQTRNCLIFLCELLPGEGRAEAADTGTYSSVSLKGYKLVPYSQQGKCFNEPSFCFSNQIYK